MKCRDRIAKLLGYFDHDRHLVSTVTVVVDQYFTIQDARERFEFEVPLGRLALALFSGCQLVTIVSGVDPRLPIACNIAHTGCR